MEVGHDEEAEEDNDDAGEFDAVVRVNAVSEVVGDGFVKVGDGGASGDSCDAGEEPTDIEGPVHTIIIHRFSKKKMI